ncbi:hypothetical protein [Planomonospora algeriensis]
MQENHDIRQDMRATLDARRDLGPEYEAALVESFVERLDATIAARVRAEVHATGPAPYGPAPKKQRRGGDSSVTVALGSLGIGIPLTAIASTEAGSAGLLLAWGGIIAVNLAHALATGAAATTATTDPAAFPLRSRAVAAGAAPRGMESRRADRPDRPAEPSRAAGAHRSRSRRSRTWAASRPSAWPRP